MDFKLKPFQRIKDGKIINQPRFFCFSELPVEVSSLINDFRREKVLDHNIRFYKNNFDHEQSSTE
jgi:hypothetical protein